MWASALIIMPVSSSESDLTTLSFTLFQEVATVSQVYVQELAKAVTVIGNWKSLCTNLGTPTPMINRLDFDNMKIERKMSECLETYINLEKLAGSGVATLGHVP